MAMAVPTAAAVVVDSGSPALTSSNPVETLDRALRRSAQRRPIRVATTIPRA
ncbi:hypothetical protein ACWCQQ_48805 [Streptomyces sp. NPDC002143]